MKQSGSADLALMGGYIPKWLFERMTKLSLHIVEAILVEQGAKGFLSRMSDPFWFQSFGAVVGMDWNSSGVTTAVMRALKTTLNPHSKSLGLYVCGGKGRESLQTPAELKRIGDSTGLNADYLVRCSRLSAKVDNTAVQDGYDLYIHSFVMSSEGDWTVIQQGMKTEDKSARRYHWHSENIQSFVLDPHAAVCGENQGEILNLVDNRAEPAQSGIIEITGEKPVKIISEVTKMNLPKHFGIKPSDVNLKRLAAILQLAQETQTTDFEDLLLLKGLGPRTLQSLALVSEVIHGTPTRFSDPARFSFAHGGKSGEPFPVATNVYDETIDMLKTAVNRAKIGDTDKQKAIAKLSKIAQNTESDDEMPNDYFDRVLEKERGDSHLHGGRTVKHFPDPNEGQLRLFD